MVSIKSLCRASSWNSLVSICTELKRMCSAVTGITGISLTRTWTNYGTSSQRKFSEKLLGFVHKLFCELSSELFRELLLELFTKPLKVSQNPLPVGNRFLIEIPCFST